jgi:uncharacterized membrane protein YeaQ/YmgE (transglycosylase-associated protein family)
VSLLIWIGVGWVVGLAAAHARAARDRRPRRRFMQTGIAGAVVGGLLASAGGLGSITALSAPGTWLPAALFAVLFVTVYQTAA